jgi:adenylate kinase
MSILFVTGIHGVGKTTVCEFLSEILRIPVFTASHLIKTERSLTDAPEKMNSRIDINASYFQTAVKRLETLHEKFIIDGHTVLLNASGENQRVSDAIFRGLQISCFVLLLEDPKLINSRLTQSKKLLLTDVEIADFQNEEVLHTVNIVKDMGADLVIARSSECRDQLLRKVQKVF